MSEFEKKIGKKGLSGLINKKEPERPKSGGYDGYSGYGGGYGYGGGGYGSAYRSQNRGRGYDPTTSEYGGGTRDMWGGSSAFGANQRSGMSTGAGRGTGDILFYEENGRAMILEGERDRLVRLLTDDLRFAMKKYRMHWQFGSDAPIRAFIEDILLSGEILTRDSSGKAIPVALDDMDDAPDPRFDDFDVEKPFSMVHNDDDEDDNDEDEDDESKEEGESEDEDNLVPCSQCGLEYPHVALSARSKVCAVCDPLAFVDEGPGGDSEWET